MKKLRIGVLGPSDIAYRRLVPAIQASEHFEYAGIAVANPDEWSQFGKEEESTSVIGVLLDKAAKFMDEFGGEIFHSYEEVLASENIQIIYIPLPPALHYFWGKKALEYGKHVLLEKPFTTNLAETMELLKLAEKKQVAVHENYAFCYHKQINKIQQLINEGIIGEVRQFRAAFGFPYRGTTDFRYNKALGGGALLDCGGYPVKLATLLLGKTTRITTAKLNTAREHNVDIFGSATLENDKGINAQVSFGMDNSYKCELEVWGSEGSIYVPRVFTTPADFIATILLKKESEKVFEIPADDQFLGSVNHFNSCINDYKVRLETYSEIGVQSKQIHDIASINEKNRGENK